MIVQICGQLEQINSSAALITPQGSGLTYQVLVSAYTAAKLGGKIGQAITLQTLEFYESQGQGSTMLPRMAGFLAPQDKDFYQLFVTCKGIGYRKALRAMAINSQQIAAAIVDRDTATLQSLPEIGKRTAENIIVNLKEKVDSFAAPPQGANQARQDTEGDSAALSGRGNGQLINEALKALMLLGENRAQATIWIDRAMENTKPPTTAQELLAQVYRIKDA